MSVEEAAQTLQRVLVGLGLTDIKGNLMLYIRPAVDDRVIHMHRVPDKIGEKADRIFVVGSGRIQNDAFRSGIIMPCGSRHRLAGGAVHDLPPTGDVVVVVDLQQFAADPLHQGDTKRIFLRSIEGCHDVALLDLIGVCLGPCVVLAGRIVGSVDLGTGILQFLRELGAVAVAQGVRTPAFHQL